MGGFQMSDKNFPHQDEVLPSFVGHPAPRRHNHDAFRGSAAAQTFHQSSGAVKISETRPPCSSASVCMPDCSVHRAAGACSVQPPRNSAVHSAFSLFSHHSSFSLCPSHQSPPWTTRKDIKTAASLKHREFIKIHRTCSLKPQTHLGGTINYD